MARWSNSRNGNLRYSVNRENASGIYFGDSAQANRAKLFTTAKMAHWSRKSTRQPATAETTELAETSVHVELSDMLLVSNQRLQICRCKVEE